MVKTDHLIMDVATLWHTFHLSLVVVYYEKKAKS